MYFHYSAKKKKIDKMWSKLRESLKIPLRKFMILIGGTKKRTCLLQPYPRK